MNIEPYIASTARNIWSATKPFFVFLTAMAALVAKKGVSSHKPTATLLAIYILSEIIGGELAKPRYTIVALMKPVVATAAIANAMPYIILIILSVSKMDSVEWSRFVIFIKFCDCIIVKIFLLFKDILLKLKLFFGLIFLYFYR